LDIVSNFIKTVIESTFHERSEIMKPTRIEIFGGSYVTMCSACRECRAKHTEPCDELWKSDECILPISDKKEMKL